MSNWTNTEITKRLGIGYPIIQGPFGRGGSAALLTATVSNAGGLGSYGANDLPPSGIIKIASDIRKLTDKPFGLNLWVSNSDPGGETLDSETYERVAKLLEPIIQVDRRGENLGRRTRIDLGLIGDVKETIHAVLDKIEEKTDADHLSKFVEHYHEVRTGLDDLAIGHPGKKPIHPQYVARMIDEIASEDAIFSCDVGTPTVWAARYLKMNGKRRLLGSFNHGSMACAMPQAIGAQLEFPGRQVVTLSGDGGLAMLLGDLLSMQQLRIPVKMVVFNNSSLAFVELEMKAAGFLENGTKLVNPHFADLAKTAGVHGIRVEDPADLKPALIEGFQHDGPALIEVITHRQELSMPPTITLNQAVGFNLWALKAVMNGRGDEVIDLAVTNLLR
jgi:pyruvate dehydrogenase (quinone)